MFSRPRGNTFVAPPTDDSVTITISENTFNFNLLDHLGTAFTSATTLTLIIDTGVMVIATGIDTPALDLSGVMFSGSTLRFKNFGKVIGKGGRGGKGGWLARLADDFGEGGANGEAGGDAIKGPGAGITWEITNGAGRIWGGGGGGGGGGVSGSNGSVAAGGGGGGGAGQGTYGEGVRFRDTDEGSATSSNGSSGTLSGGGAGGTGANNGPASGGAGGAGGAFGVAGTNGTSPGGAFIISGGTGGAAGKAINLDGGTATFLSGNGSPNLMGVVA